jgi:hypothetical protein
MISAVVAVAVAVATALLLKPSLPTCILAILLLLLLMLLLLFLMPRGTHAPASTSKHAYAHMCRRVACEHTMCEHVCDTYVVLNEYPLSCCNVEVLGFGMDVGFSHTQLLACVAPGLDIAPTH